MEVQVLTRGSPYYAYLSLLASSKYGVLTLKNNVLKIELTSSDP